MELLVPREQRAKRVKRFSGRVRWYAGLLIVGVFGSIGCLLAMFYTSHSENVAYKLGLTRVANSLENVLELLAWPVLMFMVILSIYALQRLHQLYKVANDPETYRRH